MIKLICAAWVFSEFIQALCKNLNELAHHQTYHVGLSNTCPCMSARLNNQLTCPPVPTIFHVLKIEKIRNDFKKLLALQLIFKYLLLKQGLATFKPIKMGGE